MGLLSTFEGITSGGQTKVFDVSRVSTTDEGLKKGTFDYTFPDMVFRVAANYDLAQINEALEEFKAGDFYS